MNNPTPRDSAQPLRDLTDDEKQLLHYNPNTSDLVEFVQAYAREALRAQVERLQAAGQVAAPAMVPFDLICNAIKKADDLSMEGDYMLDSNDCIAVVRVIQSLVEINGLTVGGSNAGGDK